MTERVEAAPVATLVTRAASDALAWHPLESLYSYLRDESAPGP